VVFEDVPVAYQQAAEEVRAHLVALRGGAPFLSPNDAALLVHWLDEGMGVPTILRALERASESRRKRRSRIPLTLGHAKRHLGKVTRGALKPLREADAAHPLVPLTNALRERAEADPRRDALNGLATTLETLPAEDADTLLRGALGAVRRFFTGAWDGLSEADRRTRLDQARAEFADVEEEVDEATLLAAVQEHARDRLRRDYPLLTAATLWDLVHT